MNQEDKQYFEDLLKRTAKENQSIGLQSGKKENSDLVFSLKDVFKDKFEELTSHLVEIKDQVKKTNGRVTSLEKSRTQIWTTISVCIFLGGAIMTLAVMAIQSKIDKGIQQALSRYDIKYNETQN